MKTLPLTTRIALRNMDKDSLEFLNCFHSSVILLGVVDNIWETSKKLETIQKTMITDGERSLIQTFVTDAVTISNSRKEIKVSQNDLIFDMNANDETFTRQAVYILNRINNIWN